MGGPRVDRKLAAILAADVAGYSRLMSADEPGTLAELKRHSTEIVYPKVAEFKGRVFKTTGDGAVVEFPSVIAAVNCAVAIQREMAERNAATDTSSRIEFRIGINLGDVIVDGEDLYGNGVNLAARLEGTATPGGIALSQAAFEQCRGNLDIVFSDLGKQVFKNIPGPVQVWGWSINRQHQSASHPVRESLSLPEKPSIAVLAFQNLSGDPEQEYFADGIVEEIITALSRMHWLFVIARNSSFTYKGRAVDVKQIGRELGVRYVLEGSVRMAGDHVRIVGRLIDAVTGKYLWSDSFDGQLADIFELQDQITTSVVGELAPSLERAEIARAKLKPTANLDAYDYFLRGLSAVHRWTLEGNIEALKMFDRAITLDPNFAAAYGMAARCYSQRKACGWVGDRDNEIAEVRQLARKAVEFGQDDAIALATAGIGLAFVAGETDDGAALIEQARELNPNLAMAWLFSGWTHVWNGEPETALDHVAHAMRLSPHDPQIAMMYAATACAHYFAGRDAEATVWAQKSVRLQPNYRIALCILAASQAAAGNEVEAQAAGRRLQGVSPTMRIANLLETFPIRRSEDFAKWSEGLRRAGIPH